MSQNTTRSSIFSQLNSKFSSFEDHIREMPVALLPGLNEQHRCIRFKSSETPSQLTHDLSEIKAFLPHLVNDRPNQLLESDGTQMTPSNNHRIAILFSGGPASGGHNVVAGVFDSLGEHNVLLGVKAGPKGLIQGDVFEITAQDIASIKNSGGFDFLGSDRTKIKSDEQFESVRSVVKRHHLTGIIVIGGDDSNTNAAFLADRLSDLDCTVVGVPKTIDGDLQLGALLPISFGFHTATKIYAEMVGNILKDTPSSRKYWHFVKLMGRSASHVSLEVAIQTKAHLTLISEEIHQRKVPLNDIIDRIADVMMMRAESGMYYGVVLVPEGLIEYVPDLVGLVQELNDVLASADLGNVSVVDRIPFVQTQLSDDHCTVFSQLPEQIQHTLCQDRDSHGNLQVSLIPTETLLMEMVAVRVKDRMIERLHNHDLSDENRQGLTGFSLKMLNHFFGYEGRCGAPTLFDAFYTYNLGIVAGSLVSQGFTGYMAAITDFESGGKALGLPLVRMVHPERRHGKETLVIEKALVELDSPSFQYFESERDHWARSDVFNSPGPRQLWGPVAKEIPLTVVLNQGYSSFTLPESD